MTTTDAATADTTGAASLSVAAVAIGENCPLYTSIIDFTYWIGTMAAAISKPPSSCYVLFRLYRWVTVVSVYISINSMIMLTVVGIQYG